MIMHNKLYRSWFLLVQKLLIRIIIIDFSIIVYVGIVVSFVDMNMFKRFHIPLHMIGVV